MPIITLENAGSLTREQKEKLIDGLSRVVVEITGKPLSTIYIRIDEVPRENFGVAGKPLG